MNNQILFLTSCLIILIIVAVVYNKTKQISIETIIPSIQDALAQ
jgi:hypothetical protein